MNKYFKLDKDKREIIIDKTKKYNVNVDILDLIIDLQQENKQLKEDFAVLKKLQMISNDILTKLEEWLKEDIQPNVITSTSLGSYTLDDKEIKKQVLDKIQELKERYK